MLHVFNINTKISQLAFCLKSIKTELNFYVFYMFINKYQKLNNYNNLYHIKVLWIAQSIFYKIKTNNEQNLISYILKSYSQYTNNYHQYDNITLYKYLKKFTYKYQKDYNFHLIKTKHQKYLLEIYAFIYLYVLYKVLHTNKQFYIYKELRP